MQVITLVSSICACGFTKVTFEELNHLSVALSDSKEVIATTGQEDAANEQKEGPADWTKGLVNKLMATNLNISTPRGRGGAPRRKPRLYFDEETNPDAMCNSTGRRRRFENSDQEEDEPRRPYRRESSYDVSKPPLNLTDCLASNFAESVSAD